jgi:hypothetical protein
MVAYLHAIPPRFYYRFGLYQYKQSRWLDFVYTNELPHWHYLMSPNMSERSRRLMQDKAFMAEEFGKLGLPVIESLAVVQPGEVVTQDFLDRFEQPTFIKPVTGSRMKGCFKYQYIKGGRGKLSRLATDCCSVSVWDELEDTLRHHAVIIQPLLINSAQLGKVLGCEELTTIRMVTRVRVKGARPVFAILEVNNGRDSRLLDLNTGQTTYQCSEQSSVMIECLAELEVLTAIACKAHSWVDDISLIGWDLAITEQGIRLIEGNVNWQPEYVQAIKPLFDYEVFD